MEAEGGWLARRPMLVPAAIAALMLLGASGPWPYGYYTLLRLVTCVVAVVLAFYGLSSARPWAAWAFGFVALLFNPLIPVRLSRDLWQPIDVGAAVLFLVAAVVLVRPDPHDHPRPERTQ